MPLAEDWIIGGAPSVDKEILDAAKKRSLIGATAAGITGMPTVPERLGFENYHANDNGPSSGLFNPDAILKGGRVSQAPRLYGPVDPNLGRLVVGGANGESFVDRQNRIARENAYRRMGTDAAAADEALQEARDQAAADGFAPGLLSRTSDKGGKKPKSEPKSKRQRREGAIDFHAPENSSGGGMVMSPGQGVVPVDQEILDGLAERKVLDDLAMKTGAVTTVPEIESYQQQMREELAAETGLSGQALDMALGYRMQREQVTGRPDRGSDAEAERQAETLARFKAGMRATRAGIKDGSSVDKTKAMTAEGYAKLTPLQKAAVELNALMTAATPKERREILDNLDWVGTGPGTNERDVVSGKLLYTRQDIEDLAPPREGEGPDLSLNTSYSLRDELQESLAKAFAAARKEQVAGENLLAAKTDLLYDKTPGFGDEGRVVLQQPGEDGSLVDVKLDKFFQTGFDMLADSNSQYTAEQILADAKGQLTDPEFQSFLNFIDIQSRDAKQYRQPLGETEGQTYFDPVEFRKSIAKSLRKAR